jgi:hypothetical protein
MKLTAQQVASVKQELGADPIEEANPAVATLRQAFGDHTFYLASDGLFVLEPADEVLKEDQGAAGADGEDPPRPLAEPARLILIAAWTDESKTALQPTPARATATVIDLAAAEDGDAGNGGNNGA